MNDTDTQSKAERGDIPSLHLLADLVRKWERRAESLTELYERESKSRSASARQTQSLIAGQIIEITAICCELRQRILSSPNAERMDGSTGMKSPVRDQ